MPALPPHSMLLIRPPARAAFPHPPITLSAMAAVASAADWAPDEDLRILDSGNQWAEAILDEMERFAARSRTRHWFCQTEIHWQRLQALIDALQSREGDVRLSISATIGNTAMAPISLPSPFEAIVQIQWRATQRLPELGFFKTFSRAGIWNHLTLDGPVATAANRDAIARQPNIIHSWEVTGGSGAPCADDGYQGLHALPGRPLWQLVDNPVHRFVLLDRFGKSWLMRSRGDAASDRILTLGEAMTFHFCAPDQLPEGYLDEICAMVAAGGTVAATHVRFNLERAYLIGYVLENGAIAGNSSLKHPRPQYIESVRRQSGLDLSGFVERGYTSVRPEYRGLGIGTRLLEGLTARAGDRKIFSVIAEDNEATKIIARRNRTRQVASYYSEKAGKPVGVWMPEWMIDEHEKTRV